MTDETPANTTHPLTSHSHLEVNSLGPSTFAVNLWWVPDDGRPKLVTIEVVESREAADRLLKAFALVLHDIRADEAVTVTVESEE